MSEYIKKSDAIEAFNGADLYRYCDPDATAREIINDLPAAEVVQVVRCKDCKHKDLFSCPLADNDFQKDEDFCSWGERKGGDSE